MAAIFDVKLSATDKDISVMFDLSPETRNLMSSQGFAQDFPKMFTHRLDAKSKGIEKTRSGVTVGIEAVKALPFVPGHEGGAALARAATAEKGEAAFEPGRPKRVVRRADDQTLVETKSLGDGSVLKIVFNFESRRMTEIYEGASHRTSMTGYAFADVDRDTLEAAWTALSGLGGKPRPLEDKKFKSLKASMVVPSGK
jgi:hypothetical protein